MVEWAKKKVESAILDEGRPLHKYGSEPYRIIEGYIGQLSVMKHFGIKKIKECYEYDLTYLGLNYEIKTISCKFKPPPHFLATVNSSELSGHKKQGCDRYIFVRLQNDHKISWICGWMDQEIFWGKATYLKKGEMFEGCVFEKANAAVVRISDLNPIDNLESIIKCACNTCKKYFWMGLAKWCAENDKAIGSRWSVGCPDYIDKYEKNLPSGLF